MRDKASPTNEHQTSFSCDQTAMDRIEYTRDANKSGIECPAERRGGMTENRRPLLALQDACLPTTCSLLSFATIAIQRNGPRKLEQTICHACRALWHVWATHGLICRLQGVSTFSVRMSHSTSLIYRKAEAPPPGARTPFDCCALSFQPFENPVCARNSDGTGYVFDLVNIIPWLK